MDTFLKWILKHIQSVSHSITLASDWGYGYFSHWFCPVLGLTGLGTYEDGRGQKKFKGTKELRSSQSVPQGIGIALLQSEFYTFEL